MGLQLLGPSLKSPGEDDRLVESLNPNMVIEGIANMMLKRFIDSDHFGFSDTTSSRIFVVREDCSQE